MAKKVMIALAPAGGGHLSVTRALSEALSELAPDITISAVNVYSAEYGVFPVTALPRLYALLAVNSPALWRRVYYSTSSQARYALLEKAAQPWLRPTLKAALQATQPDVIVSALPGLGNTMQHVLADLGWRRPLAVVVSDLINIHPAWFTTAATWYSVPTEESRRACIEAGIAPESIHMLGLPVSRGFVAPPADRLVLRRRLGVPEEARVVLIMGGADGAGPVEETVQQLLASGTASYPVVIAGRNERLHRRLSAKTDPATCRVLGFATNMAEWMWAADLLVTKAGPNTIMEAAHCGLPLVLTGALPGQEEGNVAFVTSNGLGVVATKPQEIVQAIGELLADDERSARIKQAMARIRRPQSAREIAQLILATCQDEGQAGAAPVATRRGMTSATFSHVAINTVDLERSLHFYHETLGFPIVEDLTIAGGVRLVHVRAGEGLTIELFGHPSAPAPLPTGLQAGLAHLALAVDDLDQAYADLRAKGVEFTVPPRSGGGQTKRLAFCKDPDGTLIELVEK